MKTRRGIMETAKLTNFQYSFDFFTCKNKKNSKAHNSFERLNQSSEFFEELYNFFIMCHVEKRRAILATCCLNNLYGS